MKEHFLSLLRNRETTTLDFRSAASHLASILAHELAQKIHLTPCSIQTPFAKVEGKHFEEPVLLIPILRAGLAMLPPFLHLFPKASIGFFGIRRDERDAHPVLYYENIPEIRPNTLVFLLDPILATGGTANLSLDKLTAVQASPHLTHLVTFLASEEGLKAVQKKHPRVSIHTTAVDPELNSQKFIIPGLGDFGDRYFGS